MGYFTPFCLINQVEESYAKQIHADFYAKDAKQTVDIAAGVYGR